MSPSWGRVGRRLCDAGSHPYAVTDSIEVQCSEHDRISEREVGDTDIQRIYASEEEFHGAAFLGPRLLR